MPSVSNFFKYFFGLPIPHQELSLKFHNILYSLSPIVDNPLYVDFMNLSTEDRKLLIKLTTQFNVLFKSNYFINDYLLKTPEMRVQFKQQFLEKKTELNFSEHTRSQFADLFEKHTIKEDFRNMQSAGLIGQLSHHPSKNDKLKKLIDEGGIDYPNVVTEQHELLKLILKNASVANPIPCRHIKPCQGESSETTSSYCKSTTLHVNNNTLRNDISCFILSNLTTSQNLFIHIEYSQKPPLYEMLIFFIFINFYRVTLDISIEQDKLASSYLFFFKLCHFIASKKVKNFPIIKQFKNLDFLRYFGSILKNNMEDIKNETENFRSDTDYRKFEFINKYINTTPTLIILNWYHNDDELEKIHYITFLKDTQFCGITLNIQGNEHVMYTKGSERKLAEELHKEFKELKIVKYEKLYVSKLFVELSKCSNFNRIKIYIKRCQKMNPPLFDIATAFNIYCENNNWFPGYKRIKKFNDTAFSIIYEKN